MSLYEVVSCMLLVFLSLLMSYLDQAVMQGPDNPSGYPETLPDRG
jgi:hypothetical protein